MHLTQHTILTQFTSTIIFKFWFRILYLIFIFYLWSRHSFEELVMCCKKLDDCNIKLYSQKIRNDLIELINIMNLSNINQKFLTSPSLWILVQLSTLCLSQNASGLKTIMVPKEEPRASEICLVHNLTSLHVDLWASTITVKPCLRVSALKIIFYYLVIQFMLFYWKGNLIY